jgi:hypothetical protein
LLVMFLRRKKKDYAAATIPLIIVPFAQILGNILNEIFGKVITVDIQSIIVIVAFAVSLVLIGVTSHFLKGKRSRLIYNFLCGGFTTILLILFLYNNYQI